MACLTNSLQSISWAFAELQFFEEAAEEVRVGVVSLHALVHEEVAGLDESVLLAPHLSLNEKANTCCSAK